MSNRAQLTHGDRLKRKLSAQYSESDPEIKDAFEHLIVTKKLNDIFAKLNPVSSGNLVQAKNRMFGYQKDGSDIILDLVNVSAGIKTFSIIKTLLLNGSIEQNGTIILDEPEIHLHPKWQLIFAEIIVLLQKEYDLHILISTHSPYFINAIEVYSAKHKTESICKYYLAEDHDGIANFSDVTNNVKRIYIKLARPLQELENERFDDV